MFDHAVKMTRAQFPKYDLNVKPPSTEIPVFQKYLPHVQSLKNYFEQSDPPIEGSLIFIELLADAGGFLFQQNLSKSSRDLLMLALRIYYQLFSSGDQHMALRATLENFLALADKFSGIDGRQSAFDRGVRVIKIREEILNSTPLDKRSLDMQIDLGRAWTDHGWTLVDMERADEAEEYITKATELYKSLRPEAEMKFRYAQQYIVMAYVFVYQDKLSDAIASADHAVELMNADLGKDHSWTVRLNFQRTLVYFAAGKLNECLEMYEDILKRRVDLLGDQHADVAISHYWLGIVNWKLSILGKAEYVQANNLREQY